PHSPPASVEDDRHSDVSGDASRPKFGWHWVDEDRRWKKRYTGPVLPNFSNTGSRELVHGATHSTSPGPGCSPLSGKICLPGLCSQPLFHGHPIWYSGWFLGRNWLDRLCIPENAFPKQWTGTEHPTRAVVGAMALTCHRVSGDRYSTRPLLAAVFSRVHLGHDGHEGADRMDLREHEKRVIGAAHACKFDRLPCRFQCTTCDSCPRSDVVRALWNCSMDCRSN